jgi:hypothetical protein
MFNFRWRLPGREPCEVELVIHSRRSWFGRKVLTWDGHTVYNRGRFAGAEARFRITGRSHDLRLQVVPIPGSSDWRPALLADGVELPETTGNPPPHVVHPPKSLAVPVGVNYLLMLLVVVMLPQASRILNAIRLRFDDRKVVLCVQDPSAPPDRLSVVTTHFEPATQQETNVARLRARGGVPPYVWSHDPLVWPRELELNNATGELSVNPTDSRDLIATVTVTDSRGQSVESAVAWVVQPAGRGAEEKPAITTLSLPPATLGEPYEFTLEVDGGEPPFTWSVIGKGHLPGGLQLDRASGTIFGTPEQAGHFPLTIRVVDDSYAASRDIVCWIAPFVVTAACLLGFVSMRKRSVYAYAVLIGAQIGLGAAGVLPTSVIAIGWQIVLWAIGLAHIGQMR